MALKESYQINGVLHYESWEDFKAKGKHYFIYWFKMSVNGVDKMVKVISEVNPEVVQDVVLSTFNNAISVKII